MVVIESKSLYYGQGMVTDARNRVINRIIRTPVRHPPLFKVSRIQNVFMGVPKGPRGLPDQPLGILQ